MDNIIQLKITLKDSKPPIWRRVLVEKNTTFERLHYIIQLVMNWSNCHLHDFEVNGYHISIKDEESDEDTVDASSVTLENIVTSEKDKFLYVYDFGDSWEHQIVVEKFLPTDSKLKYPVCTGGKLSSPPEDCGGIPGYYYMLEVLNNKKHPERKEMLEWVGGKFDPDFFDIEDINEGLDSLDDYIDAMRDLHNDFF
ncbi:MAG: plasmid pRiA4b ORF-3 family protein [Bacteroidota bacterium]